MPKDNLKELHINATIKPTKTATNNKTRTSMAIANTIAQITTNTGPLARKAPEPGTIKLKKKRNPPEPIAEKTMNLANAARMSTKTQLPPQRTTLGLRKKVRTSKNLTRN